MRGCVCVASSPGFDSDRAAPHSRPMPMIMRTFDRVMVVVHALRGPTDQEWAQWLDLCRKRAGLEARVLVENHSTGPNVLQRRALADIVRGEDGRCAVLTDSLVERNVLTAFAWLGVSLRGFRLGEYAEAGAYLGLTQPELRLVKEVLPIMRKEAGL